MTIEQLREEFDVFKKTAFLNTGTCGPVLGNAANIAYSQLDEQAQAGRSGAFYMSLLESADRLRRKLAQLIAADPEHVALTGGSSDGIARVVAGLELGAGDEVITADDEHPGLYGPLIDARDRRGVSVRAVPLADVAAAVTAKTKLVACSHVSWRSGQMAPLGELAAVSRSGIPVLLDGAQGLGAVPVDVTKLGVDFYAGSGQKWLCGPVGTGALWLSPAQIETLAVPALHYAAMADQALGLGGRAAADARRFDKPSIGELAVAIALATLDLLSAVGWDRIFATAADGAAALAARLKAAGYEVVERDRTTLVSWHAGSDEQAVVIRDRLAEQGVIIRDLPGTGGLLRASFGAYNNEDDIDRLLTGLAAA